MSIARYSDFDSEECEINMQSSESETEEDYDYDNDYVDYDHKTKLVRQKKRSSVISKVDYSDKEEKRKNNRKKPSKIPPKHESDFCETDFCDSNFGEIPTITIGNGTFKPQEIASPNNMIENIWTTIKKIRKSRMSFRNWIVEKDYEIYKTHELNARKIVQKNILVKTIDTWTADQYDRIKISMKKWMENEKVILSNKLKNLTSTYDFTNYKHLLTSKLCSTDFIQVKYGIRITEKDLKHVKSDSPETTDSENEYLYADETCSDHDFNLENEKAILSKELEKLTSTQDFEHVKSISPETTDTDETCSDPCFIKKIFGYCSLYHL
jgi:hypothetical protein